MNKSINPSDSVISEKNAAKNTLKLSQLRQVWQISCESVSFTTQFPLKHQL